MTSKSTKNDSVSDKRYSNTTERTRSRSEIETALSGRSSNVKKNKRPIQNHDLNMTPRRQQVIGGKLTGVSKRPKYGFFSRHNDIGVMNWVAVGIALLILAAFFWPQEIISTQEIANPGVTSAPQLGETDLSVDEQIDFLEKEAGASSLSFSRDDDIQRANIYRERDAKDLKIRSLLDKAKAEIENGNYTLPKENNAADTYKTVLKINSNNVDAKQGLDFITTRFLLSGLRALEQNNVALAENALTKISTVSLDSEETLELRAAIESWEENRRLTLLLANAKSAYGKRSLILPSKSNALYYYQQALLLDENNLVAIAGIQKIADTYIQFANDAVLNGQFEVATAHLATVSVIDSNHSSIPLIDAMIARAKTVPEQILEPQQTITQENSTDEIALNSDELVADVTPITEVTQNETTENNTRTPKQQTSEQEAFDKQYLKQGLESYRNGEYDVASALLQPLADKGIARAKFKLAYMYFLGRGFRVDRAVADKMIQSALPAIEKFADDGRAWAQADLGNLYEDGLVLPRSYTNAVYWYRSAAEQGYPEAQTNLGTMYARGRGVTASRRTAIGWFQLAAKQGDVIAQQNLVTMGIN